MRISTICMAAALALLAGCLSRPPYDDLVGQGRLDLPPAAWAHFQKYRREHDPGYFVVNQTRPYVLFNYCPDTRPCASSDRIYDAINACESRSGGKCRIMAAEGRIVWRGDIYVGGRRVSGAESLAAAPAARPAPDAQTLQAIYRISEGDEAGAWMNGSIRTSKRSGATMFSATFADGMSCDGEIGAPAHGAARPIEGSVKGVCLGGPHIDDKIGFNGRFRSERLHAGQMTGVDDQGRAIELIYLPGRRR